MTSPVIRCFSGLAIKWNQVHNLHLGVTPARVTEPLTSAAAAPLELQEVTVLFEVLTLTIE